MKVKFYEGSKLKWSKNFLSEANADKFIAIMEEITKPSITMESELYVNQRIDMYSVSEIATENLFVKKLEQGFKKGLTSNYLLECGVPTSICNLNEELVIQSSLDTAIRDYMVDLFSRIVCARDYAHLLHLNADSGGQHLMLEKIYEALDDMVDDCGEKYFMARNIKIPNPLVKNEIYAAGDLGDLLAEMSALCENICKDPNLDESIKSMVSGFGEDFQRCMGFWRQAQMDNPNKLTESIEKNIRVKPEVVKEIYLTIIEHLGKKYFSNEEFSYRNYLDTIKDFARELDDDFNENNKELVKEYADAVLSYSKRKPKLSESANNEDDDFKVISFAEYQNILKKVENYLKKELKQLKKNGKGEIKDIPSGPDTSKFFSRQSNDYQIHYNEWIRGDYYTPTHFFPIFLKIGDANFEKIKGGIGIIRKIASEIKNILKPYMNKNESIAVQVEKDKVMSVDVDWDYHTAWSYVGIFSTYGYLFNGHNTDEIMESVYIKRVKDGANKYFCNLNGSPAWGPKDLAIQFTDEVEAKKFLKKYDYLLSKNKITIVNESAKLKKLKESWWIDDPDDKKPEGWKEALAEMNKYEEQSEEWYSDGIHPIIFRNLSDKDYDICVGFKDVEDNFGKDEYPKDKPWSVQEFDIDGDRLKVKFFATFTEAISFANSLFPQELKPFDKFLKELKEKYGEGYIARDVWGYTHVYKNKPYYNQTIDGYYEDGSDYYRPGYWEGDKLDNKNYEYELNNAYKLQYGKSVPSGSKAIWSF